MSNSTEQIIEAIRAEAGAPVARSWVKPQGEGRHLMLFDTEAPDGKRVTVGTSLGHMHEDGSCCVSVSGRMLMDRLDDLHIFDLTPAASPPAAGRLIVEALAMVEPGGNCLFLTETDRALAVMLALLGAQRGMAPWRLH